MKERFKTVYGGTLKSEYIIPKIIRIIRLNDYTNHRYINIILHEKPIKSITFQERLYEYQNIVIQRTYRIKKFIFKSQRAFLKKVVNIKLMYKPI